MPNEFNRRPAQRVVPHSQNVRRRRKKRRRGPLMKFRISGVILIWVFSLIGCFGYYMMKRNLHPEEDIWVKKAGAAEDSGTAAVTTVSPAQTTAANPAGGSTTVTTAAAVSGQQAAETTVTTAAAISKVNPVPECPAQPQKYLVWSAFVGEKGIFDMGQQGLLQEYNVYASEALSLENYQTEYVMLNGTTIRILSALNSAKCPIYLMFGTDDLLKLKPQKALDYFGTLLNQLKAAAPDSEIYILSVPPVTAKQEKRKDSLKNATIDEYNSLLLATAIKANVYFVDINTALKNNDGKLDDAYAQEDGLHLNAEGNQALLNYVLTHVPENAKYRK
ncbi:MAG: hypothetical protein IK130_01065 [Oscillospiraceae bacterium]|nr:hypothetical protein [Oscillospiraceae bacterium]